MYSDMLDSTNEHLTTSPVFPCRQQSDQKSVDGSLSKSGSVTKFEETNHSSAGASPWLSKEHGISSVKSTAKTQSGYELHLLAFLLMILL